MHGPSVAVCTLSLALLHPLCIHAFPKPFAFLISSALTFHHPSWSPVQHLPPSGGAHCCGPFIPGPLIFQIQILPFFHIRLSAMLDIHRLFTRGGLRRHAPACARRCTADAEARTACYGVLLPQAPLQHAHGTPLHPQSPPSRTRHPSSRPPLPVTPSDPATWMEGAGDLSLKLSAHSPVRLLQRIPHGARPTASSVMRDICTTLLSDPIIASQWYFHLCFLAPPSQTASAFLETAAHVWLLSCASNASDSSAARAGSCLKSSWRSSLSL